MKALDLTQHPPRGPRATIAGLVFAARLVDKLRAAMPGGETNGYLPFAGVSELWAHRTGIDLRELQAAIAQAEDELEIENWISERTPHIERPRFNEGFHRLDTAQLPQAWRPTFERIYPEDLRLSTTNFFELIEADDRRTYGG